MKIEDKSVGRERLEKKFLILRIELFQECEPEVLVAIILGEHFAGTQRIPQEKLATEYVLGVCDICGYSFERDGGLSVKFSEIEFDFYDVCLHPKKTLISKVNDNTYLILNEEDKPELVSKEIGRTYSYLNAGLSEDNNELELNCNIPLETLIIPGSLKRELQEKNYFDTFSSKDFVIGRVRLSNNVSRELENCKIVGRGKKPRRIVIPSYINSIGHSGLKINDIWCSLTFNRNHIVRADSIEMTNVTLSKLTMTCDQVISSRLNFLFKGGVVVSELELLDTPSTKELYVLLDILVDLNRYVDLDGYFDEKEIPKTFGENIIKQISYTNTAGRDIDYTQEVYGYMQSLARWYSRELGQLIRDCIPDDWDNTQEIQSWAEYCKRLIETNCYTFDNISELMQPFCESSLMSDERYSIYQLGDTLRTEYLEALQDMLLD